MELKGVFLPVFRVFCRHFFPQRGLCLREKSTHLSTQLSAQLSAQPHFLPFSRPKKQNEKGTFGRPFSTSSFTHLTGHLTPALTPTMSPMSCHHCCRPAASMPPARARRPTEMPPFSWPRANDSQPTRPGHPTAPQKAAESPLCRVLRHFHPTHTHTQKKPPGVPFLAVMPSGFVPSIPLQFKSQTPPYSNCRLNQIKPELNLD